MVFTCNLVILWDGDLASIASAVREAVWPARLIRWAVVAVEGVRLVVEATVWEQPLPAPPEGCGLMGEALSPGYPPLSASPGGSFSAAQILPTGIGLDTGGFAGDGTPATNVLAAACDILVTHPNALNAAMFNWAAPNILYVDGHTLDGWLAGHCLLRPSRGNKIGLVIDYRIADSGQLVVVENAANAFRVVGGGELEALLTREPLQLSLCGNATAGSFGSLSNPGVLIEAARELKNRGARAIAIVSDCNALVDDAGDYLAGLAPDPIGPLEAIMSRLVSLDCGLPCAHAPLLAMSAARCDPRGAAEELNAPYITSVLRGLQHAPHGVSPAHPLGGDLWAPNLVVAPEGAMGGPGVLAAAARGIPIVAVHNPSTLNVRTHDLGINALSTNGYLEAAGSLLALKLGIAPSAVRRPLAIPPLLETTTLKNRSPKTKAYCGLEH